MAGKKQTEEIKHEEQIIEILSFLIGKQEFGIEVDFVELVSEKSEITPVPKSKIFIEGVMNLRGRILPVVDLTKLMNIEYNDETKFENVLIVKHEGSEIGFFVNEVREVVRTTEEQIDTAARSEQFDNKVRGIVQKGKRLILYLDIDEVVKACEAY
ncbi:MAG TPA: chemotaxis protein CheW [Thermotogota bacterium]|nr:chemotaxis protein CheW [Thermotogota bacterium]HPJ89970.1 chemotaxis protein CheW [Thermotogota bacterium]HPR97041.1 chemotaxis protein CheW [Thermotogota bacterium]